MFHMLSCFNLKPGITIDEFQKALRELHEYFRAIDLVQSTGKVGRRQHHPVMDTDKERDHQYFFVMTFRDRTQCDRSVEHIHGGDEQGATVHRAVWQKVSDPVFICWDDI
jgi:ABC-type cobalamin/Fe3+-siderophores transport system ATPase subunit